mgnify:CR=1 FL=1
MQRAKPKGAHARLPALRAAAPPPYQLRLQSSVYPVPLFQQSLQPPSLAPASRLAPGVRLHPPARAAGLPAGGHQHGLRRPHRRRQVRGRQAGRQTGRQAGRQAGRQQGLGGGAARRFCSCALHTVAFAVRYRVRCLSLQHEHFTWLEVHAGPTNFFESLQRGRKDAARGTAALGRALCDPAAPLPAAG